MEEYVGARSRDAGGAFPLTDDRTGQQLKLEPKGVALVGLERLWRIHDPSPRAKGDGRVWLACVDFHPWGSPTPSGTTSTFTSGRATASSRSPAS